MSGTRTERLWVLCAAVTAAVVAVAAWAFVVSPKLSQAKSLQADTEQAKSENVDLQANLGKLRSDYAHIGRLRRARDRARAALPTDNALSAFTRQLAAQARAAHVSISLVTTGNPAPVTSPAPAAAAPAADSTSAPAPLPVSTGPTAAQGLYGIPVSFTVSGSTAADVRFLAAVQHRGPRAVLVSSAQLSAGDGSTAGAAGGGSVSMTVTLQVFVEAIPSAAPAAPGAPASP